MESNIFAVKKKSNKEVFSNFNMDKIIMCYQQVPKDVNK